MPVHYSEQGPGPVRLEVDERGMGTVSIGGIDISNTVNQVHIRTAVGGEPTVTDSEGVLIQIGMPVVALIAGGVAHVKLRDREHEALVALGWTPPAEVGSDARPTA